MDWNLLENFFVNISFGLLLVGLIVYWSSLAFPNFKRLNKVGITCTILTNTCLFIALLSRWILNKYFPLSNLYESLLFLTWSLTFTHIILESKNNSQIIGSINTPLCLFIIAFASFSLPSDMQQASPLVPALRSNWLMMHVTIMMISYATLIIGSLLSILFLIIAKDNKIEIQGSSTHKTTSKSLNISSLNPRYKLNNNKIINNKTPQNSKLNLLESIDNLSYRIIGLGFPLLTIGIIAGAVWANEAWGSYWSWDPKETWALITWLIFASYLHSRLNKSWKGKKPAILASIGFFIVWICYLGVNFLGKGLHSYGWLL
uniref:cytochrome c heme attachment protein n=1 Tax=Phymatolithon calcareum TaxID=1277942 RepID=UPI0023F4936D|nr:cytochrome c heme attachment protein [Phymatolithon calcareum]WEA76768.1 cytochrome c heme attachment protein [Phymatolithon calcareum]